MAKKVGTLFLAFCVIAAPCLVNAQDVEKAIAQAKKDAAADVKACLWLGGGFLFSILAVGVACAIVPAPKAERLLGKSPEYIAAYTRAYRQKLMANQIALSCIGCAGSGLLLLWFISYVDSQVKW